MIESLVGLFQRKLLNHAFDAVQLGEIDRFFAVEGSAGGPAVDRGAFADDGCGVDFDLAGCCC